MIYVFNGKASSNIMQLNHCPVKAWAQESGVCWALALSRLNCCLTSASTCACVNIYVVKLVNGVNNWYWTCVYSSWSIHGWIDSSPNLLVTNIDAFECFRQNCSSHDRASTAQQAHQQVKAFKPTHNVHCLCSNNLNSLNPPRLSCHPCILCSPCHTTK